MSYLNSDDMLGQIQERITSRNLLLVAKHDGEYHMEFEGPSPKLHADIINIDGNPAGMKEGSYIDFGGDKEKSVTITVTDGNETYAYVEVGE